MKTIKIKINLLPDQVALFNQYISELEWLWNKVLSNQLHNHCVTWYSWAENLHHTLDTAAENLAKLKPGQQEIVRNYYGVNPALKSKLSEADKKLVAKFEIFSKWSPFSFDGIIKTPLRMANSGYEGLSCQIA
ncbi:MAG: hypothetical protein ACKPB7_36940, partial [Sphaerospermopsis kisseleviana]